jgi:integrase
VSATGTRNGILERVKRADGTSYYRARVVLFDKTLSPRIPIPPEEQRSKIAAKRYTMKLQEAEDEGRAIYNAKVATAAKQPPAAGSGGETCDQWYQRFKAYRRREVSGVDDDAWRWEKWIAPHIGKTPIRDVTADDVENVRDALTAAVIAYETAGRTKGPGRLAPKTAQNVWAALTTAMKYASTRKGPRELRVREDLGNPCADMPPPRDGEGKRRHWLRPTEIAIVLASSNVPREWREAIAIGCYLHPRPGELHELRVRDLDLAAGEVRISRAYDERKKTVKVPKTDDGIRTVTIPATLVPLLERIARDGAADDRVCPIVAATEEYYRAGLFRQYLVAAGVDRAELYTETATHLMIDFRSLRDSGITHRFLAGERVEVVQREAGHDQIVTTLGYAKEVQDRRGRYGDPFPALPPELVEPPPPPVESIHTGIHTVAFAGKSGWAERGTIPRPTD